MRINRIEAEFVAGTNVDKACEVAISHSRINNNCVIVFGFNGIRFELSGLSEKRKAVDQYHAICRTKVTGCD